MNREKKTCQNCHNEFRIEPEDFAFYEKIKVPPPTFCPECRVAKRYIFRNERSLYKRRCDLSKKEILSQYHKDVSFPVYETTIFNSDSWSPPYLEYDYTKPFFIQLKQLSDIVPRPSLLTDTVSIQHNSKYQNAASRNKDCYMVFAAGDNDRCLYGSNIDYSVDCVENFFIRECELCYECVDCIKSYRLTFSQNCEECTDSRFLYDCRNCDNCFGCVGLRNKSYYFLNQKCSKEEYKNKVTEASQYLGEFYKSFQAFIQKYPHRFANIKNSPIVTGDFIYNSRNIENGFMNYNCEDCKHCYKLVSRKSCYDVNDWGDPGELCYESITIGKNAYKCFFSNNCWPGCNDIQYCDTCFSSHHLFASIGLRNKSYCILNRQYSKEEYERLVPKIIDHMNTMPYKDKKGRVYKYGEFFPQELSPFAYNETVAQEYFPLTKEEAENQGYTWKDPEPRTYEITLTTDDLPDHIKDVTDSILKEVIKCAHVKGSPSDSSGQIASAICNEQCTTAFKIIPQELEFYRKMNLPLPRLCPNCRHYQRIKQRNPLKLWHRQCTCNGTESGIMNKESGYRYTNTSTHFHKDQPCPNEFETSYAPERPGIVYCEACYQSEII
jgi:hypothetical protein